MCASVIILPDSKVESITVTLDLVTDGDSLTVSNNETNIFISGTETYPCLPLTVRKKLGKRETSRVCLLSILVIYGPIRVVSYDLIELLNTPHYSGTLTNPNPNIH